MGAGDVIAGVIAAFMGLAGVADMYGKSFLPFHPSIIAVLLSPLGALAVFAVMTAIGVALVIGGAAGSPGEAVHESKAPVVVGRTVTSRSLGSLPDLDLAILRQASQDKSEKEISDTTGVDDSVVSEKMQRLRAEGYLNNRNKLTEKGFEALRPAEMVIVRP